VAGKVRRSIDVARLSSAVRRPDVDSRVWCTLAVVKELGFDPDHGIFADVVYMPSGEEETCLVGTEYAGSGFGLFAPLKKGDTVVVVQPSGEPGFGPVIVRKLWGVADKPAKEFDGGSNEPTSDVVLVVEPGKTCRIVVSGGGKVQIDAGGASVEVTASDVKVGDQTARPLVHAQELLAILTAWLTEISTDISNNLTQATYAQYAAAKISSLTVLQQAIQAQLATIATTKAKGT
jgi:hypothetical protein